MAGKHVFCERALSSSPKCHGLRALKAEHTNQILQTGLQRRYSRFYQMAKDMVMKASSARQTSFIASGTGTW